MIQRGTFRSRAGVLAAAMAIAVAAGCKGRHDHERGAGEDGHGHGHADEEEGHAQGAPAQAVTIWTEKTELFMEYPALIVGQEVGFAAHLTRLPAGKPLTEGTVTITVKLSDGTTFTGRADKALRAGIFRPTIKPAKAGKCEVSLSVAGPQLQEQISVGACQVFPDLKSAVAALGAEDEGGGGAKIFFPKEQQWTTEFATVPATERTLQPSVAANGEIRPAAGKHARLSAAAPGLVTFPASPPVLGMPVKKGQLLALLVPRLTDGGDRASLDADLATARAEQDAALAQLARAERLVAEQAIPERQVEEARARAQTARARLSAASGRLAQFQGGTAGGAAGRGAARNALQVRAPLAGTLVAVQVASGQTVAEGDPLLEVIDLRRVWLEARVFEPDIPRVDEARSGWFTLEGYDEPFGIDDSSARLVTVGRVVDPRSRTVPVIFELANPEEKLRIGQFAKVNIATGAPIKAVAIPESALVEEAGKPFAFVQVGGEAFERRPLVTGVRSRGWVAVTEGIKPGERVVTRGAYEIKLAASSGAIPAHGHAH